MKKRKVTILATVCFLLVGLSGIANAQSPVSFGIKGGLNLANFTGTDLDTEIRTGFTAGLSMDVGMPAVPFGIETGAYFSQKGADFTEGGADGSIELDYIEVPVLAKVNFGLPGPATPHLVLGPYVGFNINAEASNGGASADVSDDVNDTEIGGLAGLGIDFNVGLTKLNAQARYGMGFTNAFTDDDEDTKNSVVSLVVGIQF